MKRLASFATVLLLGSLVSAGCETSPSKLDGVTKQAPAVATPTTAEADHSGDVETRLRRLESNYAKHAEALDFLGKVYAQQKAQEQQQAREEHDPAATFAVDISQNLKNDHYEGPAGGAFVTIVEAWDFA